MPKFVFTFAFAWYVRINHVNHAECFSKNNQRLRIHTRNDHKKGWWEIGNVHREQVRIRGIDFGVHHREGHFCITLFFSPFTYPSLLFCFPNILISRVFLLVHSCSILPCVFFLFFFRFPSYAIERTKHDRAQMRYATKITTTTITIAVAATKIILTNDRQNVLTRIYERKSGAFHQRAFSPIHRRECA